MRTINKPSAMKNRWTIGLIAPSIFIAPSGLETFSIFLAGRTVGDYRWDFPRSASLGAFCFSPVVYTKIGAVVGN
jgi:hypothetical protein